MPIGRGSLYWSHEMGHGLSSVVVLQTVIPLLMGATTIFMAKWLSHVSEQAASERTVRVVARLGQSRAGNRPPGGRSRR
jgi:hypothetical protein